MKLVKYYILLDQAKLKFVHQIIFSIHVFGAGDQILRVKATMKKIRNYRTDQTIV